MQRFSRTLSYSRTLRQLGSLACAALFLAACSSGGGDSGGGGTPPAATPTTGMFVDSPVNGLHYTSPPSNPAGGLTANGGQYQCMTGDTVTFDLGGRTIGAGQPCGPLVTVVSVFGATSTADPRVVNLSRLLLTLGGIPSGQNPIQLPATIPADLPTPLDFSAPNFTTVLQAGLPEATPVTEAQAIAHLHASFTTLTVAGVNSGTVTSNPPGLTCTEGDCSYDFVTGTSVTLAATGTGFTGWSGDGCSGTGTCQIMLEAIKAVRALFVAAPPPKTLLVTKIGNGRVTSTPPGIDCGTSCFAPFSTGTRVTLTAMADANWAFTGWTNGTGSAVCTGAGPCAVNLNLDSSIRANFTFNGPGNPAAFRISGTVSYAGAEPRRVYINVTYSGGGVVRGTSIAAPGPFTINGVPQGTYTLIARLDNLNSGAANAANPSGTIGPILVTNADVSDLNIILTDPAPVTPITPTNLMVSPGNQSAFLLWDGSELNGVETATFYKIYWGTDTNATNGSPIFVPAIGDSTFYIQSGLINGTQYFYKITALVGADESVPSVIVPVTVGARPGLNTVSGTVTVPIAATGPLYVGLHSQGSIYYERITAPSAAQTYSISGVPNGTYDPFALVDMNNNGLFDPGDLSVGVSEGASNIRVTGNTTKNFTLTTANAFAEVVTQHFKSGGSEGYGLQFEVSKGKKRPVKITLIAGPNILVPLDIGVGEWGGFIAWVNLSSVRPSAGQFYQVAVTYSDDTTGTLTATVTGVLDSFPRVLTVTPNPSATEPTFSWLAPASPPPTYTYRLFMQTLAGSQTWDFPEDGRMPSSQTSVQYNVDGSANPAELTPGTQYRWQITVEDANGNQATQDATYTPPF